jgi:hypothetical protein
MEREEIKIGVNDEDEKENEFQCGKPCPPTEPCPNCCSYWGRMIHEGFWNAMDHCWTDKGWHEITK